MEFRDRSARLTLFGIAAVMAGGAAVALGLLHVVAFALGSRSGFQTLVPDARAAANGFVVYAGLGAAFAGLGWGSIRRRRWVPSLMLVLAWTWLLCGVMLLALAPGVLDAVLRSVVEEVGADALGAVHLVKLVMLGIVALLGVVVPAAFVWVYRDRDLQRTCEAHDPGPSWTDRCPTRVLGLSLGLVALAVLALPFVFQPAVPWFGRLVVGAPGALLVLASVAAGIWTGWATYRLRPAGWWAATLLLTLVGVSSAVTLARVPPLDVYRAMGYPEDQLALLADTVLADGPLMAWLTAAVTVLTVAYLVAIRRPFRANPST